MKTYRLRFSIIHGEHSYREWTDVKAPFMNLNRAIEVIADIFIPDHLSDERQEFASGILSLGSAILPHGERAIMNIRWEVVRPVTITVRGGIVQGIDNIPEDSQIKVVDWDNDELDGNGDPLPSVGIWNNRGNYAVDWDGEG